MFGINSGDSDFGVEFSGLQRNAAVFDFAGDCGRATLREDLEATGKEREKVKERSLTCSPHDERIFFFLFTCDR